MVSKYRAPQVTSITTYMMTKTMFKGGGDTITHRAGYSHGTSRNDNKNVMVETMTNQILKSQ